MQEFSRTTRYSKCRCQRRSKQPLIIWSAYFLPSIKGERTRLLLTNGANVPQTVVDGSQPGAVLGVGNLGQEHGGSHLGEGVSKSEQETSAHELR